MHLRESDGPTMLTGVMLLAVLELTVFILGFLIGASWR
jgi:hypothetical protein